MRPTPAVAPALPASRLRQLLAGLTAEQRDLLAVLLAERRPDAAPAGVCAQAPARPSSSPQAAQGMQFSLFFFSEDARRENRRYELLLDAARLADELGFAAVWTPERHFDPFGGPYPNPSLLAAALAMVTRRLELRAGSVVMPLHHPVRVAEEWALVDCLSGGRVGIACATGWHLADFVLAPELYDARRDLTWHNLDLVQRLWRGEEVAFPGVGGQQVSVSSFPRPIQDRLPVWVTATGAPATFKKAGELGANLLTHLSAQSVDDLREHIDAYRAARAAHGHDPARGCVSVMLHAYVGASDAQVKATVRAPMYDYLRSNLGLHARQAKERQSSVSPDQFSADDQLAMLENGFERYYEHRALFGTPATCARMVERLRRAGVDEVACLVDFGLPRETVLDGLRWLGTLIDVPRPAPEAVPA